MFHIPAVSQTTAANEHHELLNSRLLPSTAMLGLGAADGGAPHGPGVIRDREDGKNGARDENDRLDLRGVRVGEDLPGYGVVRVPWNGKFPLSG